jgi:hypothetical protein
MTLGAIEKPIFCQHERLWATAALLPLLPAAETSQFPEADSHPVTNRVIAPTMTVAGADWLGTRTGGAPAKDYCNGGPTVTSVTARLEGHNFANVA